MSASLRRVSSIFVLCNILAAAAVTGACATQEEDETGSGEDNISTATVAKRLYDVNDVSILFPNSAQGTPQPEIKMSDVDDLGAEFFSQPNFDAVKAFAENTSNSGIRLNGDIGNRASWRVVGMRFDPCAPTSKVSAADPTKLEKPIPLGPGQQITECIAQMRLIVQPFTRGQGFDTTAHLVFNLATPTALGGKDKYIGFLKQMSGLLSEIKDKSAAAGGTTVGRTLGVHPGLAKDPNNIGALVTKFIKTTAGIASRGEAAGAPTKSIAFMGLEGGAAEPWVFFAGRVASKDKWTPLPMPTSPTVNPPFQVISFLESPDQRVTPAGATSPLFNSSRDASIIKRVDDAANTHFFNMDCVSCHTSGSRTQLSGVDIGATLSPSPKGITGYVRRESSQDSSWNVRNFGYFRGKPTVTSRTLTETVDVVRYMNTVVLTNDEDRAQLKKTGFTGPARDCTAVESTVAQCFLKGGSDDDNSPEGKNGKCTAQCKGFATGLNDDPEPTDPPILPPPIVPDPQADKCDSPAATLTVSADGRRVTLGSDKAKCLSVSLGSFRSIPTDIVCAESGKCEITIADRSPSQFVRIPARRLFNALRVAPVNGVKKFEAKDGTKSLKIECADGIPARCSITITR